MGVYGRFIDWLTPGALNPDTIARHIANAHSLFNIFNAIIFFPFVALLVKLVVRLIPGEDSFGQGELKYLQDSLIHTPEIAIDSTYKEIAYMADLASQSVRASMDGFLTEDGKSIKKVALLEDAVDNLQTEITYYLSKISTHHLTDELSTKLPRLVHMINDVERIADHAENISNITERKMAEKIKLSPEAVKEIETIYGHIKVMLDNALVVIENQSVDKIKEIFVYEDLVNKNYKRYLDNHIKRFKDNHCGPISGFVFSDILNNLEKIGDHLTNVAQASQVPTEAEIALME